MKSKFINMGKKNATFQVYLSLRESRSKRHREKKFLVEGVNPLKQLLKNQWPLEALLIKEGPLSEWGKGFVKEAGVELVYQLSSELMAEISGKDGVGEVIAVAKIPEGELPELGEGVTVVVDRPNSPGNLGSLVRSAEAFGARAVLTYGHAADFFDPKAISASIGTVFGIPLGQLESPKDFSGWLESCKASLQVVALDEKGDVEPWQIKKGGAVVMIVGNETDGLSKVFKEACTAKLRIPMKGSATSLNAANSGSILLYELLVRD